MSDTAIAPAPQAPPPSSGAPPPQAAPQADPDGDLMKLFGGEPELKKQAAEPQPKPADKKPDAEPQDTDPDPADDKGDKDDLLDDPKYKGKSYAKQLREAYAKAKEEIKRRDEELTKLRETAKPDEEKPKLVETLKQREERLKTLEEQVKFYDYTKSSEYIDKYQKPYEEAAKAATEVATDMGIRKDGEAPRKVTSEEFWKIVNLKSEDDAVEAAHQLFEGDKLAQTKVARLIQHRDAVLSKFKSAENAKADFAKNVETRDREMTEKRAREQQELSKAQQARIEKFQKLNSDAVEKYPQWFKPKDGDEEVNKALERGKALADVVFGDSSKVDPEKLLAYHSAARMKVFAFDRVVAENTRMSKHLSELQKQLDGYKASGPGNASGKGGEKPVKASNWESDLDAMFKR